ncbi:MAG: hypothetical protein KF791_10190 [Verrucomicrobiae bacterium]|nr:hypothetical protein [Verrucomicrobiae bacterium]
MLGDAERQFHLTLEDVSLALHEAHHDQPVLDINQFDSLTLREVRLANSGARPALTAARGLRIRVEGLTAVPENRRPHQFE